MTFQSPREAPHAGRYWGHLAPNSGGRVHVMFLWGLQAVAVGSIGRKKLLIGGYGCMAVTQMLLTITLNLQVVRLQPNAIKTTSLQPHTSMWNHLPLTSIGKAAVRTMSESESELFLLNHIAQVHKRNIFRLSSSTAT